MKKSKRNKRIVIIIAVTLVGLIAMGFTDYHRTTSFFKKPIFARVVNGADDGGSGLYVGIGYSIDVKGNFMPEDEFKGVIEAYFYIFGNEVQHAIRD